MTTTKDLLRDDIIEVVKKYNPEVVDEKYFKLTLEDLLDTIEEFWSEHLEDLKVNEEKYEALH